MWEGGSCRESAPFWVLPTLLWLSRKGGGEWELPWGVSGELSRPACSMSTFGLCLAYRPGDVAGLSSGHLWGWWWGPHHCYYCYCCHGWKRLGNHCFCEVFSVSAGGVKVGVGEGGFAGSLVVIRAGVVEVGGWGVLRAV